MHAGTFLRGVLEKVGVEPQVKRIGKYKSAGDQLLLKDMSEPQREQLTALLEDIYEGFTSTVAHDRKKTVEEVRICTPVCKTGTSSWYGLLAKGSKVKIKSLLRQPSSKPARQLFMSDS